MPVEPQRAALNPDDDEPDVQGHVLGDKALNPDSPVEKAALNPDVDELDKAGPSEKF